MSTEEPKSDSPANSEAKAEPVAAGALAGHSPAADVDAGVAWPPPEAAPNGDAPGAAKDAAGAEKAASANDSGVMTAPDPAPKADKPKADQEKAEPAKADAAKGAADAEMPAATPQEEMGLSNSTLHWLEDGDQAVPTRLTEPGTMPSYDPRAPVPGRKRAVLVTGVAAVIALIVAGTLYAQAQKHKAAQQPPPVVVEPARDLTDKAEAALAANQVDHALELAHLALVADQRFADAHFVLAKLEQTRNQPAAARTEFRKYLELAPLGTHAADARKALATLPP